MTEIVFVLWDRVNIKINSNNWEHNESYKIYLYFIIHTKYEIWTNGALYRNNLHWAKERLQNYSSYILFRIQYSFYAHMSRWIYHMRGRRDMKSDSRHYFQWYHQENKKRGSKEKAQLYTRAENKCSYMLVSWWWKPNIFYEIYWILKHIH